MSEFVHDRRERVNASFGSAVRRRGPGRLRVDSQLGAQPFRCLPQSATVRIAATGRRLSQYAVSTDIRHLACAASHRSVARRPDAACLGGAGLGVAEVGERHPPPLELMEKDKGRDPCGFRPLLFTLNGGGGGS